jgi:hypothetical protein
MSNRNAWQRERDRIVAQVIHDAWTLARAGADLNHADWWPSLHRIAEGRLQLIALASELGNQSNTTTPEVSDE